VDITVTRAVFGGALRRMLMNASTVTHVPQMIHLAAAADYSGLIPGITATLGVSRSLYLGMGLSVTCTDDAKRMAMADIDASTAGTFIGDGPARRMMRVCAEWPTGDAPADRDEPVTADVPVLLLTGPYDPATPTTWAREVAEQLPNSLLVVLPGISHAPFADCGRDIMTEFVTEGGMIGVRTECLDAMETRQYHVDLN
jgi:pimeloyl-ACP methyl ester carboxylesterase